MAHVDAYLDPLTGDLPQISRLTTGVELIQQRIRLRLRRGLGEWFLDTTVGLPLIDWQQIKPPPLAEIVTRVQTEILAVPGVTGTSGFTATHDQVTRVVTLSGTVLYDTGDVTTITVAGPGSGPHNGAPWGVFFSGGSRSIPGAVALVNAGGT